MPARRRTRPASEEQVLDSRKQWFLQMLDVRQDTNMTRVYAAMQASSFFSTVSKK